MLPRNNRSTLFSGVAVLLSLLVGASWAQPDRATDERDTREAEYERLRERAMLIDASMEKWMLKAEVPGVVLGGVWRGERAGVGAWGLRSTMTRQPVTEETVFAAASLTKPIVAQLVLQLIDEGVLQLDQPLAEIYLPPDLAEDPRAYAITVRMILSHSSGLPNWSWERPLALEFDPGSRFQYSGEGYVWLARVVEEIMGEALEDLVADRVFEPLGMQNSSLVWLERFADDFAVGHRENGMALEPPMDEGANAAASLLTTAGDYARFMAAVAQGELVSEELRAEMFAPQVEVADKVAWGLGWGVQETSAGRAAFQWGDNPGYKAFVSLNLDTRSGVVVFTNSDNGMALMGEVVTTAMAAPQPGFEWLGYESFNSPRREVRRILERVLENEGTDALLAEYRSLKRRYPVEAFQENLLNNLGYSLMAEERFGEAIRVFALNVQEYPESFNPYDSLGEAYMRHGDIEHAIENYEKSVELNPENTHGVQMLDELRKKLE